MLILDYRQGRQGHPVGARNAHYAHFQAGPPFCRPPEFGLHTYTGSKTRSKRWMRRRFTEVFVSQQEN